MAKSAKELRAIMSNIASALRTYDTIPEDQFPKAFGITKREALLNMAKILEEAAEKPSRAIPPAKAPDDFQISGLTDAQDDDRTFEGYKISELRRVFELISNKADWKAPIDAWIHSTDLPLAQVACRFFTATELQVAGHDTLNGEDAVRVTADGYRAGLAGDH